MKDYVEQYGEPEINKKSYHECAICHETLLFIRYHLVTHVKTKHNMTITQYNKARDDSGIWNLFLSMGFLENWDIDFIFIFYV